MRSAALVVIVCAALASPAAAQSAPAPAPTPTPTQTTTPAAKPEARPAPSEADRARAVRKLAEGDVALARGDGLMKKGRIEAGLEAFEEALALYQDAYEVVASSKIYFPIGQAEQRLGRFVEALRHYEQLEAQASELSPALKAQVRTAIGEVRANLAGVLLTIEPAGARALLDDAEIGFAPLAAPVFVEPGRHTLTIRSEGHVPFSETLELTAGKVTPRRIALRRTSRESPDGTAATEGGGGGEGDPREGDGGGAVLSGDASAAGAVGRGDEGEAGLPPSRAVLFSLVGTTAAFVAAGTVTGVLAIREHRDFADKDAAPADRLAARVDGKRLRLATDVLFGVAATVGAGTAYYYFANYRPRRSANEEVAVSGARDLWFVPWAGGGEGGVAVGGGF
jgi:hypothetical protein